MEVVLRVLAMRAVLAATGFRMRLRQDINFSLIKVEFPAT